MTPRPAPFLTRRLAVGLALAMAFGLAALASAAPVLARSGAGDPVRWDYRVVSGADVFEMVDAATLERAAKASEHVPDGLEEHMPLRNFAQDRRFAVIVEGALDRLGAEGWELVTIHESRGTLVLRRPAE